MNIVNKHVQDMKENQPEEYAKLMKSYASEEDMLQDVQRISNSIKAKYNKKESGGTLEWAKRNLFKKRLGH